MRRLGTLLTTLIIVLAGCGGGVSPSSPTDAAPETATSTLTSTATPTATPAPTECYTPTPAPNPDTITHYISMNNRLNESAEVTVTVSGNATTRTHKKRMDPRSSWHVTTITEPGTYTLRVVTTNGPSLNTTITPPYAEWPARADSTSMVDINPNGTITVENVYEPILPTPVCS